MKILITGQTGYIGRSLTAYLADVCGLTVIGVSRKRPSTSDQVVESITWDELDSLTGIDCIIHLAGIAQETPVKSDKSMWVPGNPQRTHDDDYFQANTILTQRIYDFFLRSGAHTFIYFSSIKAVAESSNAVLTEAAIAAPATVYGKSKQLAEAYILSRIPHDHRNVYILRPCMIHSPGRHGNLRSLFNYIRKGFPWPFYSLDNHRSYLSMDNLNFIIGAFLASMPDIPSRVSRFSSLVTCHLSLVTPPSGIYHLCDDHPLSTNRIIEMIGDVLGKKPASLNLPAWFINVIAWSGTLLHLRFNRLTVKKMTGNLVVSNNKIKNAFEIGSMPVTAEEGMRKTLKNLL